MKYITLFLLLSLSGALACLDIYEDTVWTPEESPYEFYEHVFVHEGATLTILPGTEVRFQTGYADSSDDFNQLSGEAVAKLMWVDGQVIAVGTEEEPILFTGTIDGFNYRWSCIYLSPDSGSSVFIHCRFERAAYMAWTLTTWFWGAIHCANGGDIRVEHCTFVDCTYSVYYYNLEEPQYLYDNAMIRTGQELFHLFYAAGYAFHKDNSWELEPRIIVAGNLFDHVGEPIAGTGYDMSDVIFNVYINTHRVYTDRPDDYPMNYYGNYLINSGYIIGAYAIEEGTVAYTKRNTMINSRTTDGVGIVGGPGEIYIADNVLIESGCIDTGETTDAYVYNNLIIDGYGNNSMSLLGTGAAWNNVIYNSPAVELGENFDLFYNNTFYANINGYVFRNLLFQTEVFNNILYTDRATFTNMYQTEHPVFHHNWMSHNISSLITDGGGNIIGSDPCLADTAAYDFSLLPDSPCIDAGYADSLLAAFDGLYNNRVADGDSNGVAQIDIGPWELGATSYGGIEGYVYRSDGVTPLDITELTLSGCLPEWSDSTGYFRFDCGPGTFSLTPWHYYYEDQLSQLITVGPGEIVFVDIVMTGDAVATPEQLLQPYILQSSNYPNPFNPVTTIRYSIPADGRVELSVYNVRGQLVKRLVNSQQEAGEHSAQWEGRDANNRAVSSGVYFYRLKSGGHSQVRKMLLLK